MVPTVRRDDKFRGFRWSSRMLEGCWNGSERTGLLSIVCDKEGLVGEAHLGWIYPADGRYPLCSSELGPQEILSHTLEIRRQSSSTMLSTPRDVRSLMFIKRGFIIRLLSLTHSLEVCSSICRLDRADFL